MSREKPDVYEQTGVAMTCRSFREYVDMFQLSPESLAGPVLDVAAGASSFTAEANRKGIQAVAVDPLYSLDASSIYQHGKSEIQSATEKLSKLLDVYDWDYYGNLPAHEEERHQSLQIFHQDYVADPQHHRYIAGTLPFLPFENDAFSLVFCSHFLFLYESQFDFQFHLEAILQLVRVCKPGGRVLIYPLSTFAREPYARLEELEASLEQSGTQVTRIPTTFRFLKGATQVLQISKSS